MGVTLIGPQIANREMLRQRTTRSPLDIYKEGLTLRTLIEQQQLARQKALQEQEAQKQAQQDQAIIMQAYDQYYDQPEEILRATAGKVSPKAFEGLQKMHVDIQKNVRENYDYLKKQHQTLGPLLDWYSKLGQEERQAAWPSVQAQAQNAAPDLKLPPQMPTDLELESFQRQYKMSDSYLKAEEARRKEELAKPTLRKAEAEATMAEQEAELGPEGMAELKRREARPSEMDKAISDWLHAKNLPDTSANRNRARTILKLMVPQYTFNLGTPQREFGNKQKILDNYEQTFNADTRLKLMEGSLDAALKGDQQAMLNIVANHVQMVMGVPRGKVGRVPLQLFNEAQQSSPILKRIKARFDEEGYLSGAVLTPEQMKSMIKLGVETFDAEKIAADSKADYLDIPPDERPKFQHKRANGTKVGNSESPGATKPKTADEYLKSIGR